MQNATKLYRILKAVEGVVLVALGLIISIFFNKPETSVAIGYCVATVLLLFGVLTVGMSYIFQRGIASTDAISGVLISSLSIYVFLHPSLVIDFVPVVAAVAALIYAGILLIEATIAFVHKHNVRGSIYVIAIILLLALGITTLVLHQQPKLHNAVILIIGIFLILTGLIYSILALVQPKQDIIIQGSTLVTDTNLPATTENKGTKNKSTNSKNTKKSNKNEVKQIAQKPSKKSKKPAELEDNSNKLEDKSNKKAADETDSDDVIIVDQPED